MDKLVYTASTGMRAHMAAQTAIANNMANASTIGFRADRVVFDRIDLKGGGAAFEARMPTAEEVTDADRAPGTVQQTGNPLDVAIATGTAWLAVQAPDGSEAYTRRGDLEVTASGVLQTGDGYPVIGQTGPVTVPQLGLPPAAGTTAVLHALVDDSSGLAHLRALHTIRW
jgi:flagellar basal-body rod protein FlgF